MLIFCRFVSLDSAPIFSGSLRKHEGFVASYRPIKRDYKPVAARAQPRPRWLLWFITGLALPLAIVAVILPNQNQPPDLGARLESAIDSAISAAPSPVRMSGQIDSAPAKAAIATDIPPLVAAPEPEVRRTLLKVRSGDSLDILFRRNSLSVADLTLIMEDKLAREFLRLLKPGDEIIIRHRGEQIVSLTREIDYSRYLEVTRNNDTFHIDTHKYNLISKQAEVEGRITSSLFASAAKAGVSDTTIMNLANIFQWDIDFMLDIRHGDEFHIIVEELWRDGKRVAEGDILAAEFVNQGEVFRGIRYRDPDGNTSYFAPDGRSLRQAFLRAPLEFSRISSNFNPNRRHPILNTLRAHQGVDYAAPNGTPVKTAGDGKIIFRGVKGGYGNTIVVQHGNNISTLYGHLSRFNKQYQNGSRVRQGAVIGYVGQSGLATGPHLHYEYRKNGVHMNPRTVKLPNADPISPSLKADFLRTAAPLLAQLDSTPPRLRKTAAIKTADSKELLIALNADESQE